MLINREYQGDATSRIARTRRGGCTLIEEDPSIVDAVNIANIHTPDTRHASSGVLLFQKIDREIERAEDWYWDLV